MEPNILWINANGKLIEGSITALKQERRTAQNEKSNASEKAWPQMAQMLTFIQTINAASILRINSITTSQKN